MVTMAKAASKPAVLWDMSSDEHYKDPGAPVYRERPDGVALVRQDGDGFYYGVASGKPATFRHKREGYGEYIDGEAERIEYDGRADRVQLFNGARVRRDGGDEVRGSYISYDSKTEFFSVQSAKDASPQSRDGRVRELDLLVSIDTRAVQLVLGEKLIEE